MNATDRVGTPRRGNPMLRRRWWLGLLVLVAGLVGWFVVTATVNLLLVRRLLAAAEKQGLRLEVDAVRGLGPGGLTLKGVRLSDADGTWRVAALEVQCEYETTSLVSETLQVERIRARGVTPRIRRLSDRALGDGALAVDPGTRVLGLSFGSTVTWSFASGIVIHALEASGGHAQVGDHEIAGEFRYRGSRIGLGEASAASALQVSIARARIGWRGQDLASVRGHVRVGRPAADGRQRGQVLKDVEIHAELSGEVQSLPTGLWVDDALVTLADATYRATFAVAQGVLKSADIRSSARALSLRRPDESDTLSAGDIDLSVKVEATRTTRMALSAASLEWAGEAGERGGTLADLRAEIRPVRVAASTSSKPVAQLVVSSPEARFRLASSTLETALEGEFVVDELDIARGLLKLSAGTLSAPAGEWTVDARPTRVYTLQAALAGSRARLSVERGAFIIGEATIGGDDARLLLDVVDANETTRWTLSMLNEREFSIRTTLERDDTLVKLEPLTFEAGTVSARGALYLAENHDRGAFLIRGPLSVGVTLLPQGVEVDVPADERWLDHQLAELHAR